MLSKARLHALRAVPKWPASCEGIPYTTGIYQIVCTVTGQVYIGSSRVLGKRWLYHQEHLFKGTHTNPLLRRAFRTHGPQAFYFQVLELLPRGVGDKRLIEREQHWLDQTPNKFNIVRAGEGRPNSHRPMWKTIGRRSPGG